MAGDDMHVIIYKLLAYLYDCLKKGKEPDKEYFERTGPIFSGVPEGYRSKIITQMVDRGYVTGFKVVSADDGVTAYAVDPEITLDGVEYMFENSMMKRALSYLRDVKSALPFI